MVAKFFGFFGQSVKFPTTIGRSKYDFFQLQISKIPSVQLNVIGTNMIANWVEIQIQSF